jgi:hypothetical protein
MGTSILKKGSGIKTFVCLWFGLVAVCSLVRCFQWSKVPFVAKK